MGLLVNRVLAMRPTGDEGWSPRDGQKASIITAKLLALVDPECAKQILLAVAPNDPTPEGVRSVMENLDLLQAWALADLGHAVKVIESWVDASKGKNFWTNYLIHTLELLTTPPEERVREMLRRQGGSWVPGAEL
jgi:hypothetical protein